VTNLSKNHKRRKDGEEILTLSGRSFVVVVVVRVKNNGEGTGQQRHVGR